MITTFQAVVLGLLQGVSELFPVSSLGHSVVLPKLLNWNIRQGDSFFLVFLVATHIATAAVLFILFRKDWFKIISGFFRSLKTRSLGASDEYARIAWLLIIGTIPAGLLGLLLEKNLRNVFASARSAAFFLILNGMMLYGAEFLRKKVDFSESKTEADLKLSRLTLRQAFGVGIAQIVALIPGFSRSGATMAGSLLAGLSNEESARYSFLLATPIIAAAGVLKLPELFAWENRGLLKPAIIGALCAAGAAYFAVKFLLTFFHTRRLTAFAVYCVVAGLALTFYFR